MSYPPLHIACGGWDGNVFVLPSLEKTRQLLESDQGRKYLEVKVHSHGGWTPLHFAARNNIYKRYGRSGEMVELLIQHGANIEARDKWDRTPLMIASVNNNTSAVLVLLRHGANIKAQDKDGWTVLHRAFLWGNKAGPEMILNFVVDSAIASSSSLSLGLGKGLEEARNLVMKIRNNDGKTALDYAKSHWRTEIIQWWEKFQREKEEQQLQHRLYMLERTDPAIDGLWPHALHKAGKKSISYLWYFVHMKGPSLIAESENSRSVERGQAPKAFHREQQKRDEDEMNQKHDSNN